jgi:rhodanese-related sulfurtransferase
VERVLSGYFRSRDDMEALSREELLRRAKGGLVTILDVRQSDEFEAGNYPMQSMSSLASLTRD